jgi:hypothetical protein
VAVWVGAGGASWVVSTDDSDTVLFSLSPLQAPIMQATAISATHDERYVLPVMDSTKVNAVNDAKGTYDACCWIQIPVIIASWSMIVMLACPASFFFIVADTYRREIPDRQG